MAYQYGDYDAHGNPLWDSKLDNQELREQERNVGEEDTLDYIPGETGPNHGQTWEQWNRMREADARQAADLARRRRELDYDSRLDFL